MYLSLDKQHDNVSVNDDVSDTLKKKVRPVQKFLQK
jgi:hypothetical protein